MTPGCLPPPIPYTVNRVERTLTYVLCDGIYLNWAVFINTSDWESEKENYFSSCQEGRRKRHRPLLRLLLSGVEHNRAAGALPPC